MSVLSTGEMVRTGPRPTSPCPFFLTHRKVDGGLASAEQVRVTDSWSSTKGEADDETTVTLGGTGGGEVEGVVAREREEGGEEPIGSGR